MASQYTHIKRYAPQLSLDLRSSEVVRPVEAASVLRNIDYVQTDTLICRRGNQRLDASYGGVGMGVYTHDDRSIASTAKGLITSDKVAAGTTLYKLVDTSFTVTYVGAATGTKYASMVVDETTDTWHFVVNVEGTDILDIDCGTGLEASPVLIKSATPAKSLVGLIDAHADLTCSHTTVHDIPAAFIPSFRTQVFVSDALTVSYSYQSAYTSPVGYVNNPFAGLVAKKTDSEFELASFLNLNNCLYIGTGFDEEHKTDGNRIYRAGLPKPTGVISADTGSGSGVTGVSISGMVEFEYIDAQGNTITSEPGTSTAISITDNTLSVTWNTIAVTSGFNTDYGYAAGAIAAPTATINLDNNAGGHSPFQAGDWIYFTGMPSTTKGWRQIVSINKTAVPDVATLSDTIDGISDNEIVSCIRVNVYHQVTNSSSFYYLQGSYSHRPTAGTQSDTYNSLVTTVGHYVYPIDGSGILREHAPPPKGLRYLSAFRGQQIGGGIPTRPNEVIYSDTESPEYFPSLNWFECQTLSNERIKGIHPSNEFLAVFKPNAYFVISGSLGLNQFRVDLVSTDIGCINHQLIADVGGSVCFVSQRYGPMRLNSAGVAEPLWTTGQPLFTEKIISTEEQFKFLRAVSVNDAENARWIIFLPCESLDGSNNYDNRFSQTLVWDYLGNRWFTWDRIDMGGGAVTISGELYYCERYSTAATFRHQLFKRLNTTYDDVDYTDHPETDYDGIIDWQVAPGWEALEEPSLHKNFMKYKMYSNDIAKAGDFIITVQPRRDFVDDVYGEFTLDFSGGGSGGWGFDYWGVSPWGASNISSQMIRLKSGRSRAMSFGLAHKTRYKTPRVSGWEVEAVAAFKPRMR